MGNFETSKDGFCRSTGWQFKVASYLTPALGHIDAAVQFSSDHSVWDPLIRQFESKTNDNKLQIIAYDISSHAVDVDIDHVEVVDIFTFLSGFEVTSNLHWIADFRRLLQRIQTWSSRRRTRNISFLALYRATQLNSTSSWVMSVDITASEVTTLWRDRNVCIIIIIIIIPTHKALRLVGP